MMFFSLTPSCVLLQIDGRDLWTYLSQGSAIPSDVASVNFNFAAGPGFISSTSKSEFNDDGSYVEAIIATYEGADFKLCRNCAGEYGVRACFEYLRERGSRA